MRVAGHQSDRQSYAADLQHQDNHPGQFLAGQQVDSQAGQHQGQAEPAGNRRQRVEGAPLAHRVTPRPYSEALQPIPTTVRVSPKP